MIGMILSLASALAALHHPDSRRDIRTNVHMVQGWRVAVRSDLFGGAVTCSIDRGGTRIERGVATFRFPRTVSTVAADVRLDGGPARAAADSALEVAGQGVTLGGGDLRHPGDGRVMLPLRLIAGAKVASIRPGPNRAHRDFELAGLSAAVADARRLGCDVTPDTTPGA